MGLAAVVDRDVEDLDDPLRRREGARGGIGRVTTVGSLIGGRLRAASACALGRRRPIVDHFGAAGDLGRERERPDGDRIAAAGLDRLGQQVDVVPARGVEPALEGVDAVLPDADVDGLLLRGDVGPELGAAPVREELDAEGRARRHLGQHRPDDDRDVGPIEAERRAEAARPGWRACRAAGRAAALAAPALVIGAERPGRRASRAATRATPRGRAA